MKKNKKQYKNLNQKSSSNGVMARIRTYFFAGVLATAPLAITFYVTWGLISFIDSRVTPWLAKALSFIPEKYNPETYISVSIPGLGLIAVVVFLIFVGLLTVNYLGGLFMRAGEKILSKMPFVRTVYGALKQILESVLAKQSNAFREVVLVEYPRKNIWVMAFKTGDTKGEIYDKIGREMVNLFVPTTPNPTSGFLLFVPQEDVIALDMSIEEGIKFVVSGGIVSNDRPDINI